LRTTNTSWGCSAKLAVAESEATRRRLLEQREQIARKQSAMKERRTEVLAEIQKKNRELSDAVRRLEEARAARNPTGLGASRRGR